MPLAFLHFYESPNQMRSNLPMSRGNNKWERPWAGARSFAIQGVDH